MYFTKDEQRIFYSLLYSYKYELIENFTKEQQKLIIDQLERLEKRLEENWKDNRRVSKSGRVHSGDDYDSMLKRYISK